MKKRLSSQGSNWETVAFILINKILVGTNPFFTRSELMNINSLDTALKLLGLLGLKKEQKSPEETLQRTIQNMRDKGFINFLGNGEYKLTDAGRSEMNLRIELIRDANASKCG